MSTPREYGCKSRSGGQSNLCVDTPDLGSECRPAASGKCGVGPSGARKYEAKLNIADGKTYCIRVERVVDATITIEIDATWPEPDKAFEPRSAQRDHLCLE